MRIGSSDIGMTSMRSCHSYMESSTSMMVMVGTKGLLSDPKPDGDMANNILVGAELKKKYEGEQTYEEKKNSLQDKMNEMSSNSRVGRLQKLQSKRNSLNAVRESCVQYLIKIFLGEQERFQGGFSYENLQPVTSDRVLETLYYEKETYYTESENTFFSTEGTVKTADGKEIRINLDVEMGRSFSAYYKEHYEQVRERMRDPLVINLEGNVAGLTDQTFFFDIDADGSEEEISTLAKGSGYLALDKNGDGIINDGSELFGAESGDGFADLAAYDSDGNGWIDEGDEVWEKLLIWMKDENGEDKCYKLAGKGVGAIYTGNASTEFSLNGTDNTVNGRIRKTGIFLYENGLAGTVQHVDVADHGQGTGRFEAVS